MSTKTKPSREQLRANLLELAPGRTIQYDGKIYTVLAVPYRDVKAKQLRTDVRLLEVGKERYSYRQGIGLAAGKTIELDHSEFFTLYAIPSHAFEFVQ